MLQREISLWFWKTPSNTAFNIKFHFETSHMHHKKHEPHNNQPVFLLSFFLSEHNGVLSVAASIAAGLSLVQCRQQLPPGVPLRRGELWPVRQLQPDQGGLPGVGTRHRHACRHPTGHNPPRPVLQCHGAPDQHNVSWSRLYHPGQLGSQQQSYHKGQWWVFFTGKLDKMSQE